MSLEDEAGNRELVFKVKFDDDLGLPSFTGEMVVPRAELEAAIADAFFFFFCFVSVFGEIEIGGIDEKVREIGSGFIYKIGKRKKGLVVWFLRLGNDGATTCEFG